MDQDPSQAGEELEAPRTPEQVREEIEQTREQLGDTVAALAEKSDVKAQAKSAVDDAKQSVSAKVSEVKETVSAKKDDVVSTAQDATPESAADAGQKVASVARENSVVLIAVGAFAVGVLLGRRRAR
jgi:gas vesicle protein